MCCVKLCCDGVGLIMRKETRIDFVAAERMAFITDLVVLMS